MTVADVPVTQVVQIVNRSESVAKHRRHCVLADVLLTFDSNGDGAISHAERQVAQTALIDIQSEKTRRKKTWELFDRLDVNHDGMLTHTEYLTHYGNNDSDLDGF